MRHRWFFRFMPALGLFFLATALASPPDEVAELDEVPEFDGVDGEEFRPLDEEEPQLGGSQRDLRSIEQEVNELKERVFRSKATLQLLRELVLEGSSLGSRIVLWHVNRMSSAYRVQSVQYYLDGRSIFHRDEGLHGLKELQVLDRTIPPGTHNLQVHMTLEGHGYGIFSYVRTYAFRVQSSYSFEVEDGTASVVRVVATERGGPWRTFVERPDIEYSVVTERLRED